MPTWIAEVETDSQFAYIGESDDNVVRKLLGHRIPKLDKIQYC